LTEGKANVVVGGVENTKGHRVGSESRKGALQVRSGG
jgi:hypothetical protein